MDGKNGHNGHIRRSVAIEINRKCWEILISFNFTQNPYPPRLSNREESFVDDETGAETCLHRRRNFSCLFGTVSYRWAEYVDPIAIDVWERCKEGKVTYVPPTSRMMTVVQQNMASIPRSRHRWLHSRPNCAAKSSPLRHGQ